MCSTDVQLCDAGLPYAWVNLRHGVFQNETEVETNTAACGSFTIEMGVLSRLTGTPIRLCFCNSKFRHSSQRAFGGRQLPLSSGKALQTLHEI